MSDKYFCKICRKESVKNTLTLKEMLVGTNEEFDYFVCQHCKSLQITNVPNNIGDFYNENYYSFDSRNKIIRFFILHLHKYYLGNDIIGKFISKFIYDVKELYDLILVLMVEDKLNYDSNILDIGCGNGIFLQELSDIGFNNLYGMEPFIENEISTEQYKIYKSDLTNFSPDEKYDLIFLKDSLEHMDDPYESLLKVKSLLKENGSIIISIPIKTDYFWNLYGINWFQLDAPRHIVTFTLKGFNDLMNHLNFDIKEIIFNSNPYSIVISEDYLNGKSMYSKDSFSSRNSLVNEFNKRFKKLNLSTCPNKKIVFNDLNKYINKLNQNHKSEHAIFLITNKF